MRALTLTQPWCGLVASGIKLIENRPRAMIKHEDFNKPFALHASREIDEGVYDRILKIAPELKAELTDIAEALWYPLTRITSAVIAIATIDDVVSSSEFAEDLEHELGSQHRWFFVPTGYVLRDVRALTIPVPCRGWQGFWTLLPHIEHTVVEQLARVS